MPLNVFFNVFYGFINRSSPSVRSTTFTPLKLFSTAPVPPIPTNVTNSPSPYLPPYPSSDIIMFGQGYSSRSSLSASTKKKEPEQTFSFPLLKSGEILQCLTELQVPMTESELMEPEKNKPALRKATIHLIELCTGVTREDMSQPAFAGLSSLNYPELHEDSIPELAFLRAAGKMMRICGIPDYGIKVRE